MKHITQAILMVLCVVTFLTCKKSTDSPTATNQPPSLVGKWTMTSVQETGSRWNVNGTLLSSQIGTGQLTLGSDGSFSAAGQFTVQSMAQSLGGYSSGTSGITTGSYTSTGTSISFSVLTWSGGYPKTGFATSIYTLTETTLEVTVYLANNNTVTAKFTRSI